MGRSPMVYLESEVSPMDAVLIKSVENAENKTFGEIVDYMTNPREDSENPAYGGSELSLANLMGAQINEARNPGFDGTLKISYLSSNDGIKVPVSLEERVGDRRDVFEQGLDGDGENAEPYNAMRLSMDYNPGGGN